MFTLLTNANIRNINAMHLLSNCLEGTGTLTMFQLCGYLQTHSYNYFEEKHLHKTVIHTWSTSDYIKNTCLAKQNTDARARN